MDTNEKEIKKSRLWGLWTTINDFESAIEAARSGQFVAFYLTFNYSISIVFLFWQGTTVHGHAPADNFELYFVVFFAAMIVLLCLFLGFRIRKNIFGSVPFLAVWALSEATLTDIFSPKSIKPGGIMISLILWVISINSLRGWFGIRKYWFAGNPLEKISKPVSKLGRLLVIIIFVFFLALGTLVILGLLN